MKRGDFFAVKVRGGRTIYGMLLKVGERGIHRLRRMTREGDPWMRGANDQSDHIIMASADDMKPLVLDKHYGELREPREGELS